MTDDQQKAMLRVTISSMIVELDERLGDENPFRSFDISAFTIPELAAFKRTLKELLYAPPVRSR